MEKQEEKKIKVYTRQRRRSKSSFPLDLTSEILLRLPEKSVVRFRCVSKLWLSITTDPYFINLFKARSLRLLLCFHAENKLFVSSIPQHHQTFETSNEFYSSFQPIDHYHMEFPMNDFFPPTESVQGLICFQESTTLIVWNPSTRQLLTLPKPNMSSWNVLRIFLGYDPVESKHKVMCIPVSGSSDECRVLTLGSAQESWRTVKTNLNICSANRTSGRCINGVVYYLAYVVATNVRVLMSFDVRSEKFDKIQLPPSDVHNKVLAYQGRLACVDIKPNMKNGIRLSILEDAEKHKWSSKDFLAPLNHPDKILSCYFKLIGFTHTGELIYLDFEFTESACLLFSDPVKNSFRRLELKRITNDESVLSNRNWYRLLILPNHIESRVSL